MAQLAFELLGRCVHGQRRAKVSVSLGIFDKELAIFDKILDSLSKIVDLKHSDFILNLHVEELNSILCLRLVQPNDHHHLLLEGRCQHVLLKERKDMACRILEVEEAVSTAVS